MARLSTMLGVIAGAGFMMLAGNALAGDKGSSGCCAPKPPTCCHKPPPPPPPKNPPCCTPGHKVNVPGVNVHVAQSVVVNANASAVAAAGAIAGGRSSGTVFVGGGGWAGGYSPPVATGAIGGLNVEGKRRMAYEAKRSMFKKVVIRAVCIDDKFVPHPASQVFKHQDVEAAYDGELYRCLAGTRLQYTWSEWLGKASFEGGKTFDCRKGEALYYAGGRRGRGEDGAEGFGGALECRPQKPARDCNERSLLRRFGAGIKVLTLYWTETYTAYREEAESSSASMGMSLDGGVGGTVY